MISGRKGINPFTPEILSSFDTNLLSQLAHKIAMGYIVMARIQDTETIIIIIALLLSTDWCLITALIDYCDLFLSPIPLVIDWLVSQWYIIQYTMYHFNVEMFKLEYIYIVIYWCR